MMTDLAFMQRALELAKAGAAAGEVPVGAVLVANQEIIAEAYNAPISTSDPSAHAEVRVLRAAGLHLNNYRLLDTTLYVTLEPCVMCAGALVHARIRRLVFGAADPKAGAIVSKLRVLDEPYLNHKVSYEGGVHSDACSQLLTDFFRSRR